MQPKKKPHFSKRRESSRNEPSKSYEGIISVTSKGVGYVSSSELKEDIEVSPENTGFAFHKDTVLVSVSKGRERNRLQGKVLKVLKRFRNRFVGVAVEDKGKIVLLPDDKRIHVVFSPDKKISSNEKVFFELGRWDSRNTPPEARVIRTLGKKGNNDVEMESIVLERGFDATFEVPVVEEAEAIRKNSEKIFIEEIPKRRDFRKILTFTIDPEDAKDFDDALSFQKLPNGNFEIGVHIADVSAYLKPKTTLDTEAQKRGVSIYLVDRTIPMLPEVLSNDLCSLKPDEDKLTFSAVFEINGNAEVIKRWFGRTVIRSAKRFSYEDAQKELETKTGTFPKELLTLNTLAKKLTEQRFKDGAISFEQDEVKFELDSEGHPIRVFRKQRKDAHKLIEEFMLLANREVASYVSKLHRGKKIEPLFVYRIHDFPNQERITELGIFLKAVGYELKVNRGQVSAKDLNALFKQIEGEAEEGIIKTAAVRSMAKAIYSTKNIGHFGLGFEYYTHFTSPIRRYADVLVHRLLQEYLLGKTVSREEFGFYEKMSAQVTECEIRAAEAERDSIKLKQVEYMGQRVGQTFDGVVSGITEWGMYVEEKETKCEGMVKIRDLGNDYFILDKKNYCLIGEKTKKKFSLGDSVRFKVISADIERKTLDYALVQI